MNADDGKQLGEYVTYVSVRELRLRRDVNDLCVENKKVLEALAKTQNGTR